jgi:regulator of protease activity HflC (stomatin/prohibitin superfamily)
MDRFNLSAGQAKLVKRVAWGLPVLYLLLFVIGFPVVNIDRGHTGVDLFFGMEVGTRDSGLSFRMPFIDVVEISNQAISTTSGDKLIESPTHDLQVANISLNSSWSELPGKCTGDLYRVYGDESAVETNLILPGLLEVHKALSAKYDAYDLQQKAASIQEEARTAMTKWTTDSLAAHGLPNCVDVATVLFPHVEFSPEFAAATRDQTTTEQSIGTHENDRTRAVTDARAAAAAKIRQANADAHQIRANADAETNGIIAKAAALKQNPRLLCYMVHKGWDGKMPEISNGTSPLPFADVCKN